MSLRTVLLVGALGLVGPAWGSPERAQALLAKGRANDALDILRTDLIRHPNNTAAKYNYAVGAYALGIYASAIESLTPLATSADPELGPSSQFQLGNANFRLAEEMAERNVAGAALRFEEAVKRFDYAAAQPGEYQVMARENTTLSHAKAAAAYLQIARTQVGEGDRAARVRPEDGFPGWEASLAFFDKARKHQPASAEIAGEKAVVVDRLAKEMHAAATRLFRQAEVQQSRAPERAIELLRQSVELYGKSATYGHAHGTAGVAEARKVLGQALMAFSSQQRAHAENELVRSAVAAIEALGKAAASVGEAENLGVEASLLTTERSQQDELWYRAYVKRGDEQVEEAEVAASETKTTEQIRALMGAVESYGKALRYRPADQATENKHAALLLRLSDIYTQQGQQQLQLAKERADTKLEEALASAEKSVQSFTLAVDFNTENAPAQTGLVEAKRVLEELKAKMKEDQRKAAEKSKDEMKDPKDLKDLPKDLALKLLDYRNNNPAMKNPQLLTAPENRPRQDW